MDVLGGDLWRGGRPRGRQGRIHIANQILTRGGSMGGFEPWTDTSNDFLCTLNFVSHTH